MATRTYDDKRAELKALAEGGSEGRKAYIDGRQRIVSDQRAAIDAALAGPVRFEEGTASALDSIVRPVGDTALARIDAAGERHGASMGALDSALTGALAQHGGARQLNYDQTLSDARTATDRNIEAGEIARRKQAEREAAAAAQRQAAQDNYFAELAKWEQEALARGEGARMQEEALSEQERLNDAEFKRELSKVSGQAFSHIRDPKARQALLRQVLDATSADEIMALVEQYAPQEVETFDGLLGQVKSAARTVGRTVTGMPAETDMGRGLGALRDLGNTAARQDRTLPALDALNTAYTEVAPALDARSRQIEADRYLYDQLAYMNLGGDPLMAAGLFPRSFGAAEDDLEAQDAMRNYIETGLYGKQYEDWLKEQEEQGDYDDAQIKFDIATGASTNPAIVDNTAKEFGLDEVALYANLEPGTAGHEIVTDTFAAASADIDNGALPDEVIAAAYATVRADAQAAGLEGAYADALARIVAEQLEVYAGPGA